MAVRAVAVVCADAVLHGGALLYQFYGVDEGHDSDRCFVILWDFKLVDQRVPSGYPAFSLIEFSLYLGLGSELLQLLLPFTVILIYAG